MYVVPIRTSFFSLLFDVAIFFLLGYIFLKSFPQSNSAFLDIHQSGLSVFALVSLLVTYGLLAVKRFNFVIPFVQRRVGENRFFSLNSARNKTHMRGFCAVSSRLTITFNIAEITREAPPERCIFRLEPSTDRTPATLFWEVLLDSLMNSCETSHSY